MVDIAPAPIPEEASATFSSLRTHSESCYGGLSTPVSGSEDLYDWLYTALSTQGVLLAQVLEGRLGRLLRYMNEISSGGEEVRAITPEMADKSLRAWAELWKATGFVVSVPDAGPADDGHMVFVWNRDEHYLELEVFQDDQCELFYENRSTGQLWSMEFRIGQDISPEVVEKLGIFIA